MSEVFDPVEIFTEVAKDSLSAIASETLREELKRRAFSEFFLEVSGEAAKSITGALVGPLLQALLKALDPTRRKLDILLNLLHVSLSIPLTTGISLTRQALSIHIENENDAEIRNKLLNSALISLEDAHSAASKQGHTDEALRIRFTQATIARNLNAPGTLRIYIEEYEATHNQAVTLAQEEYERRKAELKRLEFLRTPDGVKELEATRKNLMAEPPYISHAERIDGVARFKELGWLQTISQLTAAPTQTDIRRASKEVAAAKQELLKRLAFGKFWGFPFGQDDLAAQLAPE